MADDVIANEDEKMVAEMHMLAKLALRTDQAVYNVNTGLCIVPDVNGDGKLFGIQYANTDLENLIVEGEDGMPCDALEYTLQYYPAAGTGAADRLSWQSESPGNINDVYSDDLEQSDTLDNMLELMAKDGAGWCLPDPHSIAAEADIVPQRYLDVEYVPDNADPDDKSLGWKDFLEAAEGNAAYAMRLVDRADWAYPSTMVDEDLRCNDVAMIGGKLMLTNGLPVEEADILAFKDLSGKDMDKDQHSLDRSSLSSKAADARESSSALDKQGKADLHEQIR